MNNFIALLYPVPLTEKCVLCGSLTALSQKSGKTRYSDMLCMQSLEEWELSSSEAMHWRKQQRCSALE